MAEEKKKREEKEELMAESEEKATVDSENKQAEEKLKEEEDLQTRYLRLAADFQNFRRRSEKERADVYAYANEKIVVDLLDVIDSFERAMNNTWEAEEARVMEGMALILKQLQGVLEENHVEEIQSLGLPFDPAYHNAVMTEASESVESGLVSKVLQKGYMLNKKVIRPSMVAVAE